MSALKSGKAVPVYDCIFYYPLFLNVQLFLKEKKAKTLKNARYLIKILIKILFDL